MTRIAAVLVALASLSAACGQDVLPTEPAILTRPTAVTFGCFGDVVFNSGLPDQRVEQTAQPVAACVAWASGETPPGQEAAAGGGNIPVLHAFVTQSAAGTMAMLKTSPANVIIDTDPLTPGKNAIPIGTLPIDSIADESGCYVVTANAGTCDLSALDIASAASNLRGPEISRISVKNALGDVIDAKPAAIVVSPQSTEIGNECPLAPTGTAYIAYPDCNLVAAVDLATGTIEGGLRFLADGSAVVVDGNVSCRSQCGGGVGAPPDAGPGPDAALVDAGTVDGGAPPPPPPDPVSDGAARPSSLQLETVNGQLIVGAENSNSIIIATVDAAGLPSAARSVTLEGEVGILKVKATEVIQMGGNTGSPGGTAGFFQFIYAIATDRTIRVIDIDDAVECDTQVDPRFIADESNASFLSCMPVGGIDTPPRRADARSPGIDTPRDSAPLDVEFATIERSLGVVTGPEDVAGTFAFVTTTDGFIILVNIDDDIYPDLESNSDPESTFISLAIAHQLRDFVFRDPSAAAGLNRDVLRRACALPDSSESVLVPRLRAGIEERVFSSQIAATKRFELPVLRKVRCNVLNDENEIEDTTFVSELAFAAPAQLREKTFPDIRKARNELWNVAWQGSLSRDGGGSNIDGPPIRSGMLEAGANTTTIIDPSAPFCAMGSEPFDIVQLAGCDPTVGDAQCGLGEECFVHPEAPATLAFGTCLPSNQTDLLAVQCRDFLVGNKTYSVLETNARSLVVRTRRRILDTTPIDGCISDAQCEDMADVDQLLANEAHPIEAVLPAQRDFDWVCGPDPSRKPGPSKCQISCSVSEDCEEGNTCEDGFCVAGSLPPRECTVTLQRFQVNAGEAFAMVGSESGFLHNRIVDEATGECIDNPDGNPLLVGRIPVRAPACVGDDITDLTPNPCSVDLTEEEAFFDYEVVDGACTLASPDSVIRERTMPAVRFTNPAFQIHMINLETTGDLECRNDRLGENPAYNAAFNGYELGLDLTGGFIPMFVRGSNGGPVNIRFPIGITKSFDGSLWVLDQGDLSAAFQGRVLVLNPGLAHEQFAVSAFDNLRN